MFFCRSFFEQIANVKQISKVGGQRWEGGFWLHGALTVVTRVAVVFWGGEGRGSWDEMRGGCGGRWANL